MVKRLGAVITAILLLINFGGAHAGTAWKQDTPGQVILKNYIEETNRYLAENGEQTINTLFEIYPGIAVLGITEFPDAEVPEDTEITVRLLEDRMDLLQLRVCELERFPHIAAALIRALYGEAVSAEEAIRIPEDRAGTAAKQPANSYEEEVDEMSGSIPRFYYAYYPDQYHDGKNWMQMTIIFPMDPAWNGKEMINGEPKGEKSLDPEEGYSDEYEGYFADDDYDHFELFATPTPEPDSPAGEYDPW